MSDNEAPANDTEVMVATGIQSYAMHRFDCAKKHLGRAIVRMVMELHDVYHDSLGYLYVYYAKSVLELMREDDGAPFRNILLKTEPTSSSSGSELAPTAHEDTTAVVCKTPAPQPAKSNEDDVGAVSNDEETKEDESPNDDVDEEEESEESVEEDSAKCAQTDTDDLREILECARVIFERRGPSGEVELADCMIALAECELEDSNYVGAEKDLKVADALYENRSMFSMTSMTLLRNAQCSYLMASVCVILNKKSRAQLFSNHIQTILERYKSKMGSEMNEEQFNEIRQLLPELNRKIDECVGGGELEEEKNHMDLRRPLRRPIGGSYRIGLKQLVKRIKIEPITRPSDVQNWGIIDVDEETD